MQTEQTEQAEQKENKSTKCSCTKRIVILEKQIEELRREILVLRQVINGSR